MSYTIDELKQRIGNTFKDNVIAEFGKRCFLWQVRGNSQHNNESQEITWEESLNKFCCYNCKADDESTAYFDSFDWAMYLANDDKERAIEILHEMAGVSVDSNAKHQPKPIAGYQTEQPTPPVQDIEPVKPISRSLSIEAIDYMGSRDISHQTLKDYYVTGDAEFVYLNFVKAGQLVKVKGRRLGNIKNGKNKYASIKGGTNVLYGQHLYKSQEVLIICEGEIDALSCHEAIRNGMNDLTPNILASSIPSGAGSLGWIDTDIEFIKSFKNIVLVPDNDECGRTFANKCAERLVNDVRVKVLDLKAHKVKDMNEFLIKKGCNEIVGAIGNAEDYLPNYSMNIKGRSGVRDESGYSSTGFYTVDYCLDLLQNGMLTLLAGKPHHGKSTIARQIMAFNVMNKCRVAGLFGEEDWFSFRQLVMRQAFTDRNDEIFHYYKTPIGNWKYNLTEKGVKYYDDKFHPFIGLFNNDLLVTGNLLQKVKEWITFEKSVYDTTLFIIDNLAKLTVGCSSADRNQMQGDITNDLKALASRLRIHIILIVHTNKYGDSGNAESISGSGDILNFADNCLMFNRLDNLKDQARIQRLKEQADKDGLYNGNFTSTITVEKNRGMGIIGTFPMRYNAETRQLHDLYPERITYGWTVCGREYTPEA